MDIKEIKRQTDKIIKKTGFKMDREIYRGDYYEKNNIRNIIFSGEYKNKSAILKFYHDPRTTDEPISLTAFNKNNKSRILFAPVIYRKEIISAHSGWFICEKIPDNFKKFKTPLAEKERKEFIGIFLEYRKNFPSKPTRKLYLTEKLSAENYHILRISRWFELAQKKEADRMARGKKQFLGAEFLNLYEKVIKEIRNEFMKRKLIWCHGHFKPHEIFTDKERTKYYLIDFAHTAMFPEGYELGFIAWADYMVSIKKWSMDYSEWRKGIYGWISDLEKLAKELKYRNYKKLVRASLIERVLGTILADITASGRPEKEIKQGIDIMTKLLKEFL